MRWFDKTELVILGGALASAPLSFHLTIWCLAALMANTVVKICCGGFRYNKEWKWLWLFVAYWGMYLLSMLWTTDVATGWKELGQLAPLPLFALVFLFSDMRYLSKEHLRMIFWALAISAAALFVVRSGVALYRHRDCLLPLDYFFEPDVFDTTHHTYISIYLAAALAFLYREFVTEWKQGELWFRILLCCCTILIYCFIICKNSRGGHVLLLMLAIIAVFDQFFWHKKPLCALAMLCGFGLIGFGSIKVVPEEQERKTVVTMAPEEVSDEHHTDNRFLIIGKALHAAKDNLPWGVGAGDRTVLYSYYTEHEATHRILPKDPHNQYADTLMTTGIPGLLILLSIIFYPFILIFKGKRFSISVDNDRWVLCIAMVLLCSIITALFESLLERQLGLLFFSLTYCLAFNIIVDVRATTDIEQIGVERQAG